MSDEKKSYRILEHDYTEEARKLINKVVELQEQIKDLQIKVEFLETKL